MGIVAASKLHVLHFSLSVLPLKISEGAYGPNILVNQSSVSQMNIF